MTLQTSTTTTGLQELEPAKLSLEQVQSEIEEIKNTPIDLDQYKGKRYRYITDPWLNDPVLRERYTELLKQEDKLLQAEQVEIWGSGRTIKLDRPADKDGQILYWRVPVGPRDTVELEFDAGPSSPENRFVSFTMVNNNDLQIGGPKYTVISPSGKVYEEVGKSWIGQAEPGRWKVKLDYAAGGAIVDGAPLVRDAAGVIVDGPRQGMSMGDRWDFYISTPPPVRTSQSASTTEQLVDLLSQMIAADTTLSPAQNRNLIDAFAAMIKMLQGKKQTET